MAFSMRRLTLHCAVLTCLLAWCAPAHAASTSTVPSAQRLAEIVGKFAHKQRKGQAKTNTGTAPSTSGPASPTTPTSTTPVTPTATVPRTAATTPGATTTPGESSSAAAGAIESQLRALEQQGKHARKGKSSKLSGAALALAIVGGLLALGALLWALFRFAAIEPRWLLSLRHALAEAGFRASSIWSEFTDWARLGH
jgi:cobalamin biosynthesis Mg chelatase CobN